MTTDLIDQEPVKDDHLMTFGVLCISLATFIFGLIIGMWAVLR